MSTVELGWMGAKLDTADLPANERDDQAEENAAALSHAEDKLRGYTESLLAVFYAVAAMERSLRAQGFETELRGYGGRRGPPRLMIVVRLGDHYAVELSPGTSPGRWWIEEHCAADPTWRPARPVGAFDTDDAAEEAVRVRWGASRRRPPLPFNRRDSRYEAGL